MTISPTDRKRFRGIGHGLHPVVTVGSRGLTESLYKEADRALRDHELIKVRLSAPDREQRRRQGNELCVRLAAELVQQVGKLILLYRHNPEADPRLSNLRRSDDAR